jgi:hypothetical protein
MSRLLKAFCAGGIVYNAMVLVDTGLNVFIGATNERTIDTMLWFVVGYVVFDLIQDIFSSK